MSELRDTVLRMGTFVEGMLARAMQALVNRDVNLALEVRRSDDVADALDVEIEEVSTRLLALQQPLARDLRAVIGAVRIGSDLERIGDYSKDIAKTVPGLSAEPLVAPLEDIPAMAARAGEMIRLALRCFVDRDLELARQVAEMDKGVDELWKKLHVQLLDHMRRDPAVVNAATQLLLIARYLERIGDHTVNVVERVHYMETGRLTHLV
jgi:phosphate transport system protein